MVSRSVIFASFSGLATSSSPGISGGGGAGGVPKIASRIKTPRFTGDVRVGFEVTASTLPWVSTPPRALSGGNITLRIVRPVTPGMP